MYKEIFIPLEERSKPFGTVIVDGPLHCTIPVQTWDYSLKMWEVTNVMEDPDNIVAKDLQRIPSDCCIQCHNKIKHYKTKYYKKCVDENYNCCFEISENTGYCEECAIKETEIATISRYTPREVATHRVWKDDQECEVKVYADGSTIEEMSHREIAQKKF